MKVLICGGRDFGLTEKERSWAFESLDAILGDIPGDLTIISGCARGADSLAIDWATARLANVEKYPADWSRHGKRAGYIRNTEMLHKGMPDLVIAFPGGKGTKMMKSIAKGAGVKVIEVTETYRKS